MISNQKFHNAIIEYNLAFKTKAKVRSIGFTQAEEEPQQEDKITIQDDYSIQEIEDIISQHRLNCLRIITGKGILFNTNLRSENTRFLETCNDLILQGKDPYQLLEDLNFTQDHFNKFWTGKLAIKDKHWKPLIQIYNVSPLYAYMNSQKRYLDND